MSRRELKNGLRSVLSQPETVITSVQQLSSLVPHLDYSEVQDLLTTRTGLFVNFIGPPLWVRGAEHVFTLTPRGDKNNRKLVYAFCYRRQESYACCAAGTPLGHQRREFDHRERVANYAETEWGTALLWDRAAQIIEFEIVDPTRTSDGGGLFSVATVTASMDEVLVGPTEYEDDDEFASDCPFVEAMTHSIINYSAAAAVRMELRGDHMPVKVFNCAFCGGGMGATGCDFCGCPIESPTMQSRVAWSHPLPLEIAEEAKVEFKTPPIQAIKCEYQRWAAKDYNPPQLTIQPRRQRSVVLRED